MGIPSFLYLSSHTKTHKKTTYPRAIFRLLHSMWTQQQLQNHLTHIQNHQPKTVKVTQNLYLFSKSRTADNNLSTNSLTRWIPPVQAIKPLYVKLLYDELTIKKLKLFKKKRTHTKKIKNKKQKQRRSLISLTISTDRSPSRTKKGKKLFHEEHWNWCKAKPSVRFYTYSSWDTFALTLRCRKGDGWILHREGKQG